MANDLADWQEYLTDHYSQLKKSRTHHENNPVLFALEHGLDLEEIESLNESVRAHIEENAPSHEHDLVWIVYATEIGYSYSGDEFWQTFEDATPGWQSKGNRHWLRDCFRRFRVDYAGAEPTGTWADHFRIICWPITHAILPKDLQRQFAQVLYESRRWYSNDVLESPSLLGELVAYRSWNTSSRFRHFVGDAGLIGQISRALLIPQEERGKNAILDDTLDRIVNDLNKERETRVHLVAARRFAQNGLRIRGLKSTKPFDSKTKELSTHNARDELGKLGLRPRLTLIPKDIEQHEWQVILEIPNLKHLIDRFPQTAQVLQSSRSKVAGTQNRQRPPGIFLYGKQPFELIRWPNPHETLIEFENSHPHLEWLLKTECLLQPGTQWLFRVSSDGSANEVVKLQVKPGEHYILVTKEPITTVFDGIQPIALVCEGVYAYALRIPEMLNTSFEEQLNQIGIHQVSTLEVWPVGLSATYWDGSGCVEWFQNDPPCIGLRTNRPCERLIVSATQQADIHLQVGVLEPNQSCFIALPLMPVGEQLIKFTTYVRYDENPAIREEYELQVRINDPPDWASGIDSHASILISTDPAIPSLEELWEGQVDVFVWGPSEEAVTIRLKLLETDDSNTTHLASFHSTLPIDPGKWARLFDEHIRHDYKLQTSYDMARVCELEFEGGFLGKVVKRYEREFSPLRWSLHTRSQRRTIRLHDDTGLKKHPLIARISFESPTRESELEYAESHHVPKSGGMFIARHENITATKLVSPDTSNLNLAELVFKPNLQDFTKSDTSLLQLFGYSHLWQYAKSSGSEFSSNRRLNILLALRREIVALLCGKTWATKEIESNVVSDILKLRDSVSNPLTGVQIGNALVEHEYSLRTASNAERVRFVSNLAQQFDILPPDAVLADHHPLWMSELALRSVSNPSAVPSWAREKLASGIHQLMRMPTLVRMTRFLVLLIDAHLTSKESSYRPIVGWDQQ